jgi:site-specific DNA-methyltransferase (adenine-specific)
MMTVQLILGDCLEVMKTIATASIDCIVTDPPYSINTKSDGQDKLNPWADRINSAYWYKEWMGEARRILKPSGCLWSFLNWRSMVTFQKATDDLRWSIESVLVWDKCWIGPGGPRGLRPSYELVGLWANSDFSIDDRGLYDIQRFKWSSIKPTGHPAEKPIGLIKWLIEISTKSGQTIVDLFFGSGTTAIACLETDRNFIGCEVDPIWYEYVQKRIHDAQQHVPLPMVMETA